MLWSKQFYHYVVTAVARGDPGMPPPRPPVAFAEAQPRLVAPVQPRRHLDAGQVGSTRGTRRGTSRSACCRSRGRRGPREAAARPFCFARVVPAPERAAPREWAFDDVNRPCAWASGVSKMSRAEAAPATASSSKARFQKLLLNFTWWVNRKGQRRQQHLFAGGFLGLDNVGVFDRSQRAIAAGGSNRRTARRGWRSACGTCDQHRLRLARTRIPVTDLASKFFEHFVAIADAMNHSAAARRRTTPTASADRIHLGGRRRRCGCARRSGSSAHRGRSARRRRDRRLPASAGACSGSSRTAEGPREPHRVHGRRRRRLSRRTAIACSRSRRASASKSALTRAARRAREFLRRTASARCRARTRSFSLFAVDGTVAREVIPRPSTTELRRELNSRTDSIPAQPPLRRGARKRSPLLRRHAARRVPDRVESSTDSGSRSRTSCRAGSRRCSSPK